MNPYLATGTANPDSYSTLENQTLNVGASGVLANDTDPNNLPLQAILLTTTTNGTLTLNANGSFQYVPNTNFNGHDAFIYQASNGGTTTAPVVVSITVAFVNQPPSFTKGANQIVNNYDLAQTRVGWASNILPGPANESSQTVQFIVSNDNNSIFSVQPFISANGTLTYAPAVGHYGTAVVSVKLKDNGGIANGGNDTSTTQMFSILVNNPPTATINTPTNTSLFLYPSPVDIVATATDIDGTVTNLTFLNGTNVIGQGTPAGNNTFTFTWTNAPFSNSVLRALATDNYGATNLSAPINIQLGNPVLITTGAIGFSPSLFSWAQKLSVTNPTISVVQSVTITFTSVGPVGTSIVGVTGTNALGQPYITFNNIGPARQRHRQLRDDTLCRHRPTCGHLHDQRQPQSRPRLHRQRQHHRADHPPPIPKRRLIPAQLFDANRSQLLRAIFERSQNLEHLARRPARQRHATTMGRHRTKRNRIAPTQRANAFLPSRDAIIV